MSSVNKNKKIKKNISWNDQKLNYIKNNTEVYTERLQFIISFLSYLQQQRNLYTPSKPGVYGSFVRKIFEFPYALLDYLQDDKKAWGKYGNFLDGDIDFYIQKHDSNCKGDTELRNIINNLDNQLGIYIATKMDNLKPTFGKYSYVGSTNTNEYFNDGLNTSPCCITKRLFFKSDGSLVDNFSVDLTSCITDKSVDLSVNSGILSFHGINTGHQNFLDMLESIKNKYASISNYSFKETEYKTWFSPITRIEKVINLNQHISFLKKRVCKLMDKGYNLEGYHIPSLKIEKLEDCPITSTKAPYPVIEMECGHSISIMAYTGIINKGESDYSEAIRCPLCRQDLKLKLIHNDRKVEHFTNFNARYQKLASDHSREHTDDKIKYDYDNICSSDALKAINEMYLEEEEDVISEDVISEDEIEEVD